MDAGSTISGMSEVNPSSNKTFLAILKTLFILAAIYFIFSYPHFSETSDTILEKIALSKTEILLHSQYWRFITGPLFHANIEHLFANSIALYMIGYLLNPLLSEKQYWLTLLFTLLGSDAFSLLLQPEGYASIGFSGVCFGLEGMYFGLVLQKAHSENPSQFLRQLFTVCVYIVITAGYYFTMPQADHMAHIGGFFSGIIASFLITRHRQIIR